MEIYLAVITTVLVLTQIIRVTQNWVQLRHLKAKYSDQDIKEEWEKLTNSIERLIEIIENKEG